jgi:hypothetical protein
MGIDYLQLVLVLLGGSGLAGWFLTYLQFREERREQGRLQFRELVMTNDFVAFLGCLHSLLYIVGAVADLKKGRTAEMVIKDAQGKSSLVQIKREEDLRPEFDKWLRNLAESHDTLVRTGVLFLLPSSISSQIITILETARDHGYDEAQPVKQQLAILSAELKRILGLAVLE